MKWYLWVIIGFAAIGLIVAIAMNDANASDDGSDLMSTPDPNDVEALGRMIASENPNDILLVQQAIAWTALNWANRKGISVAKLLMPNGIPGPQAGRYASTANPSTDATRSVAYDVLSGAVPDPTGGAVQFDAPSTQDWLYAHGKASNDAAMIAASRMSEGKVEVDLPGVDPNHMRWWRYA